MATRTEIRDPWWTYSWVPGVGDEPGSWEREGPFRTRREAEMYRIDVHSGTPSRVRSGYYETDQSVVIRQSVAEDHGFSTEARND